LLNLAQEMNAAVIAMKPLLPSEPATKEGLEAQDLDNKTDSFNWGFKLMELMEKAKKCGPFILQRTMDTQYKNFHEHYNAKPKGVAEANLKEVFETEMQSAYISIESFRGTRGTKGASRLKDLMDPVKSLTERLSWRPKEGPEEPKAEDLDSIIRLMSKSLLAHCAGKFDYTMKLDPAVAVLHDEIGDFKKAKAYWHFTIPEDKPDEIKASVVEKDGNILLCEAGYVSVLMMTQDQKILANKLTVEDDLRKTRGVAESEVQSSDTRVTQFVKVLCREFADRVCRTRWTRFTAFDLEF
jgi:hypothetical protein